MSWFGWLTKPKLEVTLLDELIMFGMLASVILIVCTVWFLFEERKRKQIKKKHGEHCTCWTCMGIR